MALKWASRGSVLPTESVVNGMERRFTGVIWNGASGTRSYGYPARRLGDSPTLPGRLRTYPLRNHTIGAGAAWPTVSLFVAAMLAQYFHQLLVALRCRYAQRRLAGWMSVISGIDLGLVGQQ